VPSDLDWTQSFLDQAIIDLATAQSIHASLTTHHTLRVFPEDPEQYYPVIVAHCQQAIEKALKAVMCVVEGVSARLLDHNPMKVIRKPGDTRVKRVLKKHSIVFDREESDCMEILNMAPGASVAERSLENLLRQRNSEYPYLANNKVVLPWETTSNQEVVKAIRLASVITSVIKKYVSGSAKGPPN